MELEKPHVTRCSYPKYTYDAIHKWQVAKGFDPSTPDFARSLGYPILERVTPEKSRFEEVAKEEELEVNLTSPKKYDFDESFLSRLSKLSWWQATSDIPVGVM
ncbi:hypothetical protein VNI00_000471 [Paramarasmius palmivorus]|uniref:Uncharacterized protein n=1 Tax=Paramarasmius palmivorus TaxID=297713 RepID=A0AAW0EA24_9AGAR